MTASPKGQTVSEESQAAEQLELYRLMRLIRAFDGLLPELYTKGLVKGSTHAAVGQEAVAVGACSALEPTDLITSTHRGHGHAIAKGADVRRMILCENNRGRCRPGSRRWRRGEIWRAAPPPRLSWHPGRRHGRAGRAGGGRGGGRVRPLRRRSVPRGRRLLSFRRPLLRRSDAVPRGGRGGAVAGARSARALPREVAGGRVAGRNLPMPYAEQLEKEVVPARGEITAAVRRALDGSDLSAWRGAKR